MDVEPKIHTCGTLAAATVCIRPESLHTAADDAPITSDTLKKGGHATDVFVIIKVIFVNLFKVLSNELGGWLIFL